MLKLPFPKLAFLFFVFASPFLHQSIDGKGVVPYMYWWTGMDAIRRVAYLPHHMMGEFFLVTSIIFLLKYIQSQKGLFLKILFILLLPLSFILPSSLFITLLFLPPVLGFLIVKNKFRLDNWLFGLLGYWIIGLFLLFAMVSQTSQGFPWSQYIEWERRLQFPLDRELLGALGIITPLTVLGAFKAISSKRIDFILVSSWFLMPLALIPFAQKLNLSNSRLIQGVPYLPLAILATLGAKALVDFVSSSKMYAVFKRTFILKSGGTSSGSPKRAVAKTWSEYVLGLASDRTRKFLSLNNIMVSLIVLTFAISTVPTLSWSFKDQIREYWPIFGNVYLDDRIFDAFRFIDTHYPNKPIVLATFYAGNYLPAYTNTQAFVGHFGYTYNVDVKDPLTFRFFKSDMQEGEAKDFLLSNKIVLVFQGPEEKGLFNSYLYPTLLKPVYDQGETTIYEVTVSK